MNRNKGYAGYCIQSFGQRTKMRDAVSELVPPDRWVCISQNENFRAIRYDALKEVT